MVLEDLCFRVETVPQVTHERIIPKLDQTCTWYYSGDTAEVDNVPVDPLPPMVADSPLPLMELHLNQMLAPCDGTSTSQDMGSAMTSVKVNA